MNTIGFQLVIPDRKRGLDSPRSSSAKAAKSAKGAIRRTGGRTGPPKQQYPPNNQYGGQAGGQAKYTEEA